ncbi:hypothetical protein SAMN02745174_00644 [Cetobacterium ceti]|uniref:Uncharacterized protein n=1 Tax=Cetobacterium ceti TaxID=180163 RepID=A0A1T4KXH9_9FUSO|nr:hypothetical protein [Cetobacterium ceti]SJZ47101.1 hypothetical protein SAMN02745174_00644 [Cetobacterium ceti]
MEKSILEKDVEIKVKTNIKSLREIILFLESELMSNIKENMDNIDIKDEDKIKKYRNLKEITYKLCDSFFGNLIDIEKQLIERLIERDIEKEKIIEILSENKDDKNRIKNIYRALKCVDEDEKEKKEIMEKLLKKSVNSLINLQRVENQVSEIIYTPHLYRFFWCLYNGFNLKGEIVFSENSLEKLLDLDREELELFLDKLKNSPVYIGKSSRRLLENYIFLNENTLKIIYDENFIKGR